MINSRFAGTSQLVTHAWRRDRLLVLIWGLVLVGICYASATATSSLYPGIRERISAAEAINASPAIVALYGPILDVHSLGELAMTKMTVLYAVFLAALFVVLMRRHTRAEEEAGQAELLAGTAVGPDAPLASAVFEAGLIAFALGSLTAAVNMAGGLPAVGSLTFGAGWFGIGLVATGIAAVACQISASARTCGALAASALGFAYALRAVGDASGSRLSWLSPFGWTTQLRAYSDTRWWVLGLYTLLAGALIALAHALRTRRDLGSGLVAAAPGPYSAASYLRGACTLALRIHTPALLAWTAATVIIGAAMGAIVPQVTDLLDSTAAKEMIRRLGGAGAMEHSLIAAELSIAAVAVSCFGIATIAHSASDEDAGRTELVLATATSRARSFAGTMLMAFLGAAWLLIATGLALTLGYGATSGFGDVFSDVMPAAVAQIPPAWTVIGLTALAFAIATRWVFAGWLFVVLCVTVGQISELLGLPSWVAQLSPYTHTSSVPFDSAAGAPELILCAMAVLLVGTAWLRYRSRDIR